MAKVDAGLTDAECWIWRGNRHHSGYGRLKVDRDYRLAHRVAYELFVGSIPDGLVLDHFACENPGCVNPRHVRPVTQRENLLRGDTLPARCAAKTQCPKGHAYTPENTLMHSGSRECRECNRLKCRERYDRQRRRHQDIPRP
jgi:hypothetical protein